MPIQIRSYWLFNRREYFWLHFSEALSRIFTWREFGMNRQSCHAYTVYILYHRQISSLTFHIDVARGWILHSPSHTPRERQRRVIANKFTPTFHGSRWQLLAFGRPPVWTFRRSKNKHLARQTPWDVAPIEYYINNVVATWWNLNFYFFMWARHDILISL